MPRLLPFALALAAPLAAAAAQHPEHPTPADPAAAPAPVIWKGAVERLLQDHCASCHEPGERKGGLDVTSFAALRQGGGSGRTLQPGDPERSRLFLMIAQQERPFMPKGDDPLNTEQVQLLRTWIEQGACEDEASARAFAAARAAAAKAAPVAPIDSTPGALPQDLPPVPLQLSRRPPPVKGLLRSPRADLLALPGLQQLVLLGTDLKPLGVLPCDSPDVECANFAPDGSLLAIGLGEVGRRGAVAVHDVRSGRCLATIGDEADVPLAVAVHAAAGLVALGGAGKRAHVFGIQDGRERFAGAHDDFVLALQFSPDGALLAAGDRAGTVQLWETRTGRIGQTLTGTKGAVNGLVFSPGGDLVVTAGADGVVRAFDTATGKEAWKQSPHQGEATAVAAGPGGAFASCGQDGRIAVYSPAGKLVATSPPVGEWLYAVAFGATADVVFAGDWQGRVHRFDGKSKKTTAAAPLAGAK